ncbi:MAG TPA: hypothetical protein PLQ19_07855 [Aeromicrobium sp.]|nr:hypothetical protein [Aeromicrobium sp.]
METKGQMARHMPLALWLAVAAVVTAFVVAKVVIADTPSGPEAKSVPKTIETVDPNRDSDGDGIADRFETAGWHTQNGRVFVTDPTNPDTDGDGLTDGEEAGPKTSKSSPKEVFQGVSDPTKADSDGDFLDDASEIDAGTNPWSKDTDRDKLDDFEEIEFGSDPRTTNVDGDHLDDAAELREDTDPNVYDLTGMQAAHAFTVAIAAGDWEWGADRVGRLNDKQINSWQYLAGAVSRGFVPGADATDVIANLAKGAWTAAMISLVALVPFLGDGAKAGDALFSFAKKGGKATQSAMALVARNPSLSNDSKIEITRKIVRRDPDKARLSQDAAVRGKPAPPALAHSRPIARDPIQNALKDKKVAELQELGFVDIRVNQQQVNAKGVRVGTNRPDIQATAPDGTRHYWEYDKKSSTRGPAHQTRILSNDDSAKICLLNETGGYKKCA